MKKSCLLLGIIMGIGVIWAGSTWYCGVQIEKQMDSTLHTANQQLQRLRPGAQLQLVEHSYQRGFFSSQLQLRLALPSEQAQAQNDAAQQLRFIEKISHGPFPFAQFSFKPAIASIHTQLVKNQVTQLLFDAAKGLSPIEVETRLHFNQASQTRIHFQPMDLNLHQQAIKLDDSQILIQSDPHFNQLNYQGQFNQLSLTGGDSDHGVSTLAFNGLTFSGNTHLSAEGMRVGQQHIAAKSINLSNTAMDAIGVSELSYQHNYDSINNKLAGTISYHAADMTYMNQSLGRTDLQLAFANFTTSAVNQLLNTYQSGQLGHDWYESLALALGNNAELDLKHLSLTNQQGSSQLQFKVSLRPLTQNPPQTINVENLIRQYLKQLNITLSVSRPMATELMAHIGQAQGYSASEAQRLADNQVKQLFDLGVMFHLGVIHDDQLHSALTYHDDFVVFNQNKMPLSQFLAQYVPANVNY